MVDWISLSEELLKKRTVSEATTALQFISNALHISSHSDKLMEMKAEALLTVCNFFSFAVLYPCFFVNYYTIVCLSASCLLIWLLHCTATEIWRSHSIMPGNSCVSWKEFQCIWNYGMVREALADISHLQDLLPFRQTWRCSRVAK